MSDLNKNMKIVILIIILSFQAINIIAQSGCPSGYEERDVKCNGSISKKCVPSNFTCNKCWHVIYSECNGSFENTIWGNWYNTYDECVNAAKEASNRQATASCPYLFKYNKIILSEAKLCETGIDGNAVVKEDLKNKIKPFLKRYMDEISNYRRYFNMQAYLPGAATKEYSAMLRQATDDVNKLSALVNNMTDDNLTEIKTEFDNLKQEEQNLNTAKENCQQEQQNLQQQRKNARENAEQENNRKRQEQLDKVDRQTENIHTKNDAIQQGLNGIADILQKNLQDKIIRSDKDTRQDATRELKDKINNSSGNVVECSNCNGTGSLKCNDCEGNGYNQCVVCSGNGNKNCPICSGTGRSNNRVCVMCGGKGANECSICFGKGKTACVNCSGFGHLICRSCGGIGQKFEEDNSADNSKYNTSSFYNNNETNTASSTNDLGTYKLPNGIKFEAPMKNGYPNGYGTCTNIDGTKQKGLITTSISTDGKINIDFKVTPENNNTQINNVTETKTINYDNGSIYVGQMKDGKRNGKGIMTLHNGIKFEGEFRDDNLNGHGILTSPQGDRYEGDFVDFEMNGHGIYIWPGGEKYEGEFRNNKKNGHGIYTVPDGGKYDGEFKDGIKNGYGIYTWKNGEKYEGEFKDGKRNGKGMQIYPNGKKEEGIWKDDALVSITNNTTSSNTYNNPNFINNNAGFEKKTITYDNGNRYVGQMKDGKKCGKGIMTTSDGDKFEGEFKEDKRNGKGVLTHPNGQKEVGIWKDDILVNTTETNNTSIANIYGNQKYINNNNPQNNNITIESGKRVTENSGSTNSNNGLPNTLNPDILFNKGFDAYKIRQFEEARKYWDDASNSDKNTINKYRSMNELGNLYFNGQGVAKDYSQALKWYNDAANGVPNKIAGDANAAKSVGTLYENGYGVQQDFSKALEWYKKALQLGNKYVNDDIKRMNQKLKGGK